MVGVTDTCILYQIIWMKKLKSILIQRSLKLYITGAKKHLKASLKGKNKEDTVLSSCASHFNKIHQHLLVPHLQSKDNAGYNYEFTGDPLNFLPNNQGLLVEEECILKKDEISELNKVFNFPSNFQVNVAPFGTPEGISVSPTVKNNDSDLLICRKANQR
ncbi:hypothetical protein ACTFIW_006037 [Dictyostelium discoideum]